MVSSTRETTTDGAEVPPSSTTPKKGDCMKGTKPVTRRTMAYGFDPNRDAQGEMAGVSWVKLVRKNAYELIGLRRPTPQAQLRLRVG
jgi:hypothetical protein